MRRTASTDYYFLGILFGYSDFAVNMLKKCYCTIRLY